ncbi:MAG: NAD(P)H-binding protein [Nocardioidaceae bacterium]|nr:NAD(P)H-binding protein [Nocardioidaceae bacterium]MCL2611746.1 NAD(P)H-binding protein [Nocardioidaceae bacterium]
MADVVILGGHGKVALRLAPLLVRLGDRVTGVVRNPDHQADVAAVGATPVVADVESLDVAGLAKLLEGHDAVVWSAGAGGGDRDRTYAVDRDAAIRSMEAAETAGATRYVMVSYLGAGADHGVDPDDPFFAYADAKSAADAALRDSSLLHTILGPGHLTLDEPTGMIDVVRGSVDGETSVTRGDVAAVAAAVVHDDATIGRTIDFHNGTTPILAALHE